MTTYHMISLFLGCFAIGWAIGKALKSIRQFADSI